MADDEYLQAMEAQRRAFEAQFGSLEDMGFEDKTKNVGEDDSSDQESQSDSAQEDLESHDGDLIYGKESDFESSEDEFDEQEESENDQPIVVKFADETRSYQPASKEEVKLLKSGKAYKKRQPVVNSKKNAIKDTDEDIKNDLELQRFLQESHILSNFNAEASGADLTLKTLDTGDGAVGKARRYTLNSRLQQASSINGHESKVGRLENISMAMRKGMVKAYDQKVKKYEQEARDGGIILSKVKRGEFRNVKGNLTVAERIGKGVKSNMKDKTFRQKGLKINSVGRSTRNGLVISKKDIERINGPSGGSGRGGKKGGSKRGRR